MAEGGEADWELCKENIQPLKRGRDISALHQALSLQQEGSSSVTNQHKQAFETELRVYDGDDPLDVWDRYIKWTEQTFPQGGKESNLNMLLEQAVKRFTEEKKYHNDIRYVDLWIKLAEQSSEPLEIYRYLRVQGIGTLQASLYVAWSEEYEKQGNNLKADRIYQEAFRCGAEPREKLLQAHKALQARVSRQVLTSMGDKDEDEEDLGVKELERISLVDLKHRGKKKAIAPINRVGTAILGSKNICSLQPQGGPAPSGGRSNVGFMVFDENKADGDMPYSSSVPKMEAWVAPPTSKAKENELRPEKWSSVKMPQRSRFGASVPLAPPPKPKFQPFVEDDQPPPMMTPCKINPAVNTVLSARKPCRDETPLKRLQLQQQREDEGKETEQHMYCKELLLSGTSEFCFEELRAERYRQKILAEEEKVSEE